MNIIKVSLVVPIYNEENSLEKLVKSINYQTLKPDEVIFVDGGSIDKTLEVFEKLCSSNPIYKLIKTHRATPGMGRNIGTENARNDWIAYTDAGIVLDKNWLAELVETAENNRAADIIYGNFAPLINESFDKVAALAYVAPQNRNGFRGNSIASSLIKKQVWRTIGGFPDLRAAEDLMFMEIAGKLGFKTNFAPKALMYWQLCPNFFSVFRKFILYSKFNVWIGREWQWHYGIAKQYLIVLPFVIAVLLHSWWWLTAVAAWVFIRTAKRILQHRYEFSFSVIFNPFIFVGVMCLILTIDLAMYIGWMQGIFHRKPDHLKEIHV